MTSKDYEYLSYIKDNLDKKNFEIAEDLGEHPSIITKVLKKCKVSRDLNSIEKYLAKHRKSGATKKVVELPQSKIKSSAPKSNVEVKEMPDRAKQKLRKDTIDVLKFIANNLDKSNTWISKKLKVSPSYVTQLLKYYELQRDSQFILNFISEKTGEPIVAKTETQPIASEKPVVIEKRDDESKDMPNAKWELVTPIKAQRMLDKNKGNRRFTQSTVDTYVMEMNRGNWEEKTGEPIQIDVKGNLINGQHRLMAIVKSGKSFHFLVVRDLPTKAFQVLDTGRIRTAGDVLSIQKFENPSHIAAMAKFIIGFKKGKYNAASQGKTRGTSANRITNADVLSFSQKNKEELLESYNYGYCKENQVINGAFLSGLHFIFNEIDSTDADDFCHRLAIGDGLSKDSPIMLLRQTLFNDKNSQRKMKPITKIAVVCKAWNLYRKNEKTGHLKFMLGKESFPKPI